MAEASTLNQPTPDAPTEKPKRHRLRTALLVIVALVLAIGIIGTAANHFGTDYNSLSEADQETLGQYDAFLAQTKDVPVWKGYQLNDHPVMSLEGRTGSAYLINPSTEPGPIFATRIDMPSASGMTVYRLAVTSPDTLLIRFSPIAGSFPNELNPIPTIEGSQVFWERYSNDQAASDITQTFLSTVTHEAFHKLEQENWAWDGNIDNSGRFSTEEVNDEQLTLLDQAYGSLAKAQEQLELDTPDPAIVKQGVIGYLDTIDQLKSLNPDFYEGYTSAETFEGTAQYVRDKANQAAGIDLPAMYSPNRDKSVPFSEVVTLIRNGDIDVSLIPSYVIYESGVVLCESMDLVGYDYQDALNNATPGNARTLEQLAREAMQQS